MLMFNLVQAVLLQCNLGTEILKEWGIRRVRGLWVEKSRNFSLAIPSNIQPNNAVDIMREDTNSWFCNKPFQ